MSDMHVLAVRIELRLQHAQSLKDKRQVVRSLVDGARRRFGVSAAEVGLQDRHRAAVLGFAVVASTASLATQVIAQVEDHVWSHPEIEVVATERTWLET